MPLEGSAFLALWNDVDPARDVEYDAWHTHEHVPERVGITGFLAGRRYAAREREHDRYFTLYEIDALSALAGSGYAEVVDHPTAWSRSMRPALRNFQRHPCAIVQSLGAGVAGSIATLRFGLPPDDEAPDGATAHALLAPLLDADAATAAHLGRTEPDAAFPLRNAGDPAATGALDTYVLLIEGVDRTRVATAATQTAGRLQARFPRASIVHSATFDLIYAIRRRELRYPTTERQPPRRGA